MDCSRLSPGARLIVPATLLLGFGGCLGPNPGFFISMSAVNASIFGIVQRLLAAILGGTA